MIEVMPDLKEIRDLFSDLLGRPVPLQATDVWPVAAADNPCTAEFVDDQGTLAAVAVLDLDLTVYLGASIGLVPAGGAQDMAAERDPSPMVLENAYEVLNIVSALFNTPQNSHLRLGRVHTPGTGVPPLVGSALESLANRVDVTLEVPGYGSGRLVLVKIT